jgi:hypothetical protein
MSGVDSAACSKMSSTTPRTKAMVPPPHRLLWESTFPSQDSTLGNQRPTDTVWLTLTAIRLRVMSQHVAAGHLNAGAAAAQP